MVVIIVIEKITNLFNYFKLRKEYNALIIKHEALVSSIKDECFKVIYNKINDDQSLVRLKKQNKLLRQQVKALKEIIKEGNNGRNNSKKTRTKSSTRNKSRSRIKSK